MFIQKYNLECILIIDNLLLYNNNKLYSISIQDGSILYSITLPSHIKQIQVTSTNIPIICLSDDGILYFISSSLEIIRTKTCKDNSKFVCIQMCSNSRCLQVASDANDMYYYE